MLPNTDLTAQVDKLRADIFWTKCIAGLLILSLFAVTVLGWTKRSQVLEATQFVLKDEKGNILARLGPESFGSTCLTFTAKVHSNRSELCVANDGGSWLSLYNTKTGSHVLLTAGRTAYLPSEKGSGNYGPLAALLNDSYSPTGTIPESLLVENTDASYLRFEVAGFAVGHRENSVFLLGNPDKSLITLFGNEGKAIWSAH